MVSSPRGRILGVCLTNWSFGEAQLGIKLLKSGRYSDALFVISPLLVPLFKFHGIQYMELAPGGNAYLNRLQLMSATQEINPTEILLADPLTFIESKNYFGITPEDLLGLGVPVTGVDIYAFSHFGERDLPKGNIFGKYVELTTSLARHYIPCPMFDPALLEQQEGLGKVVAYSSLGGLGGRSKLRNRLDPCRRFNAVVTCAAWEDKIPLTIEKRLIQDCSRQFLFDILVELGKYREVHVDIVGMTSLHKYFDSDTIDSTYHSVISPSKLNELLAKAAVYITSNGIAASIGTSFAVRTPVVCLQNSKQTTFILRDDSQEQPQEISIEPFLISPIGWYDFLQPLLCNSRYSRSMIQVEIGESVSESALKILDEVENIDADWKNINAEYLNDISRLKKTLFGSFDDEIFL